MAWGCLLAKRKKCTPHAEWDANKGGICHIVWVKKHGMGTSKHICAQLTGNVWKILVKEGDIVSECDTLMILESMKRQIPVEAPEEGTVLSICVKEGDAVNEGAVLAILQEGV